MRPEYEAKLEAFNNGPLQTTAVRLQRPLLQELGLHAEAEDDRISGLIREGIMRVIEDRRNDPDHMAMIDPDRLSPLQGAAQAQVEHLSAELARAQATLEALTPNRSNQHWRKINPMDAQ